MAQPPVGYSSSVDFLTHPFFNVVVAYRLEVGTRLNLKPVVEYITLCLHYASDITKYLC